MLVTVRELATLVLLALLEVLEHITVSPRLPGLVVELVLIVCCVLGLVERLIVSALVNVVKDCLPLNEDVMCIFLSNGLTVHEDVILLPQQICEILRVHALIPQSSREELLYLPVGSEHVECAEVRGVEEVK